MNTKWINISKWLSLVIGLILLITGVNFLINPLEATITIITWLGSMFIFIGIIKLIRYFGDSFFKSGGFLVSSILDIIVGVYIIKHNLPSLTALTMVIGFWQLFTGISAIAASIDLRSFNMPRWWLAFISGIISIIFGYAIIRNMTFAAIYISAIVAIDLILYGITYISTFFGLDKISRKYK